MNMDSTSVNIKRNTFLFPCPFKRGVKIRVKRICLLCFRNIIIFRNTNGRIISTLLIRMVIRINIPQFININDLFFLSSCHL